MSARKDMRHSTDRRVVKTRTAIEEAFIELLETTEYDKITISAIAQKASINRKTFYLHYASIEELLDQAVESLANRVVDSVAQSFNWDDTAVTLPVLTQSILEELSRHANMESNLVKSIEFSEVLRIARKPLTQRVEQARKDRGLDPLPHLDYYVACYLGAIFGAYDVWVQNGCIEGLDTIADLLHKNILSSKISSILA